MEEYVPSPIPPATKNNKKKVDKKKSSTNKRKPDAPNEKPRKKRTLVISDGPSEESEDEEMNGADAIQEELEELWETQHAMALKLFELLKNQDQSSNTGPSTNTITPTVDTGRPPLATSGRVLVDKIPLDVKKKIVNHKFIDFYDLLNPPKEKSSFTLETSEGGQISLKSEKP